MEITLTAIEGITPYARNARKIPQQAIDKVAASIQEFGWRQPVVVDGEGVIICGHTRWIRAGSPPRSSGCGKFRFTPRAISPQRR